MQIGYARVSRGDSQDLDPQLRALTDAGCSIIYREEASGAKSDRPELALAIEAARSSRFSIRASSSSSSVSIS